MKFVGLFLVALLVLNLKKTSVFVSLKVLEATFCVGVKT